MAWNAPVTVAVGQSVAAALWNAQVRDNMLDLDSRVTALAAGSDVITYAELTSGATVPTTSSQASPQDVVSLPAATYPNTRVEFVCAAILNTGNTVGATIGLSLWEGSTDLGWIGYASTPAASSMSVAVGRGLTIIPSAGTHTYKVRAWATGSNGSYTAAGGGPGTAPKLYVIARRAV